MDSQQNTFDTSLTYEIRKNETVMFQNKTGILAEYPIPNVIKHVTHFINNKKIKSITSDHLLCKRKPSAVGSCSQQTKFLKTYHHTYKTSLMRTRNQKPSQVQNQQLSVQGINVICLDLIPLSIPSCQSLMSCSY